MGTTVVATFLEYDLTPTWLTDSDGHGVYSNQALAKTTARPEAQRGELNGARTCCRGRERSLFYYQARCAEQSFAASGSSSFQEKGFFERKRRGCCVTKPQFGPS
jgi:hypothetical protein